MIHYLYFLSVCTFFTFGGFNPPTTQDMVSRNRLLSLPSRSTKKVINWNDIRTASAACTFPEWPKHAFVSRGDYREEAHLEKVIGGPLYVHQRHLPRLPIPTLEETAHSLLPTAIPLAASDDEVRTLIQATEEFVTDAEPLQQRLEKRNKEMQEDSSWLQLWWNQLGYLRVRDPVVVNVSYFFQLEDDDTLPPQSPPPSLSPRHEDDDNDRNMQIARGAAILTAVAEYRKLVCSGSLPAETIGRKNPKTPLCSTAFKYMFHSCRIPRREADVYKIYDPSRYQHCIVAIKGQFFSMNFVDDKEDPMSISTIERGLRLCLTMARKNEAFSKRSLQLGLLSGGNRDTWARNRTLLKSIGGLEMESALHRLESGAVLLCLDDEVRYA